MCLANGLISPAHFHPHTGCGYYRCVMRGRDQGWPHLWPSDTEFSPAAGISANILYVLQLAGIAVLAIGLWLRFDSQTKSIFEQENNHSSFYTGKGGETWYFPQLRRFYTNPGP